MSAPGGARPRVLLTGTMDPAGERLIAEVAEVVLAPDARPDTLRRLIADADVLAEVTKLAWPAFLPCSDKSKTRAQPDIWTEQAKFKEAADKMQAEVAKLDAAAKTGNLDSIKAAVGPVGQSCKACHDNYRKE